MRLVIQRVKEASVKVEDKIVGQIAKGFLVLLGITQGDTKVQIDKAVSKLLGLRVFEDQQGKMNLDIKQVQGEVLVVSQFTLYGDMKKGRRPSFESAAPPDVAEPLYEYFLSCLEKGLGAVERGIFGAYMQVNLVNDGPVTLLFEN